MFQTEIERNEISKTLRIGTLLGLCMYCIINAMSPICGRCCMCFGSKLFNYAPLFHASAILGLCVTILSVGQAWSFSFDLSSSLPPLFPLHIFHLSESTKTKFFHASVALDMSVLLYCSEVNASRLWTAEMTNAPRYVPLQEVDRQREMERDQPVFNISSQMGVQQMTCRSCRHETPAAAASQLAVVNMKTTE